MSGSRKKPTSGRSADPVDAGLPVPVDTVDAGTDLDTVLQGDQPIVQHPPGVHEGGHLREEEPQAPASAMQASYRPRASTQTAPPPRARRRKGRGTPVPDVGPSRPDPVAPPGSDLSTSTRRAYSLDALRGLFLILMTLGFTIQVGIFPEWMYHRQFPPPGDFVPIAGIAWRDLAYGAFLFTMAAALPITLSRRIEKGETEFGIFFAALRRGALLFLFALLIGHSNTYFIGYTQEARVLAVIGFVIMFALFTRRRSDWSEKRFRIVNIGAWIAAIAFLALSPLVYDDTFSPERRDDVIAALAFAAVVGSIVWYATRNNMLARLGVLAAAAALHLGAQNEGWVDGWWWSSPAPWLVRPSYLVLLTVVIPGTVAGDLIVRWMRDTDNTVRKAWSNTRLVSLALLAVAFTPLAVIGLYNRWVFETTQITAALVIAGAFLVHAPRNSGERLLRGLFVWAAAWLLIGLLLDPAEGGITKVPDRLSYYFTISGLTMMLLVSLTAVVDLLGRVRAARPLIEVGQNPMLMYILFTVFLNSIFELIAPLRGVLRSSPGESILRSIVTLVVVVLLVQLATRRRIFWRT
jgi:predicted acyltransferase